MEEAPHRGTFDEYHIQNAYFTEDGRIKKFKAFAESDRGVFYVGSYPSERRKERQSDVENITTAGIVERPDGRVVRIKVADVGLDWPAWWTEEVQVWEEDEEETVGGRTTI